MSNGDDFFPFPRLPLPGSRPRGDRIYRDPRTGQPVDIPRLIEEALNPPSPSPPVDAQPQPEPIPDITFPLPPPPVFVPNAPPPGVETPVPYPLEQLPPRTGPPTLGGYGLRKYEDPDPRGRRTRRELERAILRDGARRGKPFYAACEDLGLGGGDAAMEYCDSIVSVEEYRRIRSTTKAPIPETRPGFPPRPLPDMGQRTRPRPTTPRVRPRRTPREPFVWPRRRRRADEPLKPSRRGPGIKVIPRVIPGNPPDWTSPFPPSPRKLPPPRPQPTPRVQPRPLEVPRTAPDFPIPPPQPPSIPRLPSPFPPPTSPPSSPPSRAPQPQPQRQPRPQRQPQPRPRTWPFSLPRTWPFAWPFTSPGPGRPAPWQIPLSEPLAPSPEDLPLPIAPGAPISPLPLPSPSPFSPPLTALNPAPVRCAPCPTSKRKQRRKCRARAPVRWAGGPRKGELAGSRCYSFLGGK